MASPSPPPDMPDPAPALSSAYPDLARRLGTVTMRDEPAATADRKSRPKRPSFLKRVERYVSAILKLGRTYRTVKDLASHHGGTDARLEALGDDMAGFRDWRHHVETRLQDDPETALSEHRALLAEQAESLQRDLAAAKANYLKENASLRTEISETAAGLTRRLAEQTAEQAGLARAYSDLTRRLDLGRSGSDEAALPEPESSGLDALTESFYARLEDRYRGAREEIGKRLVKYLPDVEATAERTGKPVLDLGCGRGEWLELLRSRGMTATGVDLNEMQLREARDLGLDVHLGDACKFLADAEDASYGMITAHHLAEHLPFKTLVWMTREALRVLAPGGMLLYETPNPRNVVVGASSFHVDPTHIRPLPAEVLTTLLDTVGFHPVESRFLHPHPKYDELIREGRLDAEIAGLLFGPQDLAVLGTKPGSDG